MNNFLKRVMTYYNSLPEYKENQVGRFKITKLTIPAGQDILVVSHRQAIFEQIRPMKVKVMDDDITAYHLHDANYGVWMSSTLQEIGQMDATIRGAKGNVLIGGFGLGVIANLLAVKDTVKNIVVVERESDLIQLVKPFIRQKIQVVPADLFEFLKNIKINQFDMAYFDIWQSTGEWTWQTQVVPLRRLAAPKIKKVECWQEEVMHGQMMPMLYRAADMSDELLKGMVCTQHYWVFRQAVREKHLRLEPRITEKMSNVEAFKRVLDIQEENSKDQGLQRFVRFYLTKVGTPRWEKTFGGFWDETLPLFDKNKEE